MIENQPAGSDSRAKDLAARIDVERELIFEICRALEHLADNLPRPVSPALQQALLNVMATTCSEHVQFQEDVVFPLLTRTHSNEDLLLAHIEALQEEHRQLTCIFEDVTEQIRLLLADETPNSDMLGYMLRGAFQSWRRHLQLEERVIDPNLPRRLAPVDMAVLAGWLAKHPLPGFAWSPYHLQ